MCQSFEQGKLARGVVLKLHSVRAGLNDDGSNIKNSV